MRSQLRFILLICLITNSIHGIAQDTLNKHPTLKGLPVLFYLPETRIGAGGVGILTFHMKKDTSAKFPSSITLGAAYTLNKQVLLFLPYNLYLQNRKHWMYGEFGYYKYIYNFYGVGNPAVYKYYESYSANFARMRLSALTRLSKSSFIYTGLKYAFDQIKITQLDSTGLLYNTTIDGNKGGTVSGLGWVTNYDTRNNFFYPTKGQMIEFFVYGENKSTGSSFNYARVTLDASAFKQITKNHVMAFNFYGVYLNGNVPFTHLGQLGGESKMRGYYEGRYRDKVALTWQTEWRYKFLPRFGMNVFASTGIVAPNVNALMLTRLRYAAGGGLRFVLNEKQGVNLRADIAFGHQSTCVYFTLGEAF